MEGAEDDPTVELIKLPGGSSGGATGDDGAQPADMETIRPLPPVKGLVGWDICASAALFRSCSFIPRPVHSVLEFSGHGLLWLPLIAGLWLSPLPLPRPLRDLFLSLFLAFFVDLAAVSALKAAVRRPRPVYNRGMTLVVSVDHWSFPSGHASRALLIAAFAVCSRDTWRAALPLHPGALASAEAALVAWGLATALSRVLLGRHYLLDVAAGSLLGILEGCLAARYLRPPERTAGQLHALAVACLTGHPICQLSTWQAVYSEAVKHLRGP